MQHVSSHIPEKRKHTHPEKLHAYTLISKTFDTRFEQSLLHLDDMLRSNYTL